ncbi:electron transport complex subunit RsxB [Ideonella sp.]|uniref:electron transport complex subunit RsxB n=1 Tax=Ideonella sp. TaxID=1929293 RepID=UPI002B459543|nr:electron transport complex subunit RsxB [Ideonella sp.]HJV70012.1 electron transport complex subunit RsxB [Ideonella sp.]
MIRPAPTDLPPAQAALAERLNDALPQTQCTRCGYPDCHGYAAAIATGEAGINQCPPGGAEGIARLAAIASSPVMALNPENGHEGPRGVAIIDESWCIGCTLCIKACPVDCIVGAAKKMHTVIEAECTGCELCLPACPVDCIAMAPVTGESSGWSAWSSAQAAQARERYAFRQRRLAREKRENDERLAAKAAHKLADLANQTLHTDPAVIERKRAVIEAAMARARAQRAAAEQKDKDDLDTPKT